MTDYDWRSPGKWEKLFVPPSTSVTSSYHGRWTQTFAQIDAEAGAHGFDEHYFVQQVAGLSQIAGELMLVKPQVIDLGWGKLKSALVDQYVATFRKAEKGAMVEAKADLKQLQSSIDSRVATDQESPLKTLVDGQFARLG